MWWIIWWRCLATIYMRYQYNFIIERLLSVGNKCIRSLWAYHCIHLLGKVLVDSSIHGRQWMGHLLYLSLSFRPMHQILAGGRQLLLDAVLAGVWMCTWPHVSLHTGTWWDHAQSHSFVGETEGQTQLYLSQRERERERAQLQLRIQRSDCRDCHGYQVPNARRVIYY